MITNTAENERGRQYTFCATCGAKLNDSYYTFTEPTLHGTVFFELDGSDNAFCGKNCACDMLRLSRKSNKTNKNNG